MFDVSRHTDSRVNENFINDMNDKNFSRAKIPLQLRAFRPSTHGPRTLIEIEILASSSSGQITRRGIVQSTHHVAPKQLNLVNWTRRGDGGGIGDATRTRVCVYTRATRMRARVYAASALSRRPILIIRRGRGGKEGERAVPAAGLLEEGIKRSRSSYPVFKAGLESEQREADACATCARVRTENRNAHLFIHRIRLRRWRYYVWNIGINEDCAKSDPSRRNFPASLLNVQNICTETEMCVTSSICCFFLAEKISRILTIQLAVGLS